MTTKTTKPRTSEKTLTAIVELASELAALKSAVAATDARMAALDQRTSALGLKLGNTLGQITTLFNRLDSLKAAVNTANTRVVGLDQRLYELTRAFNAHTHMSEPVEPTTPRQAQEPQKAQPPAGWPAAADLLQLTEVVGKVHDIWFAADKMAAAHEHLRTRANVGSPASELYTHYNDLLHHMREIKEIVNEIEGL